MTLRGRYIPGDNYVTDDITGFKVRARDVSRQDDGLITHRNNWSPKHPQESVRGLKDRQAAEIIRSEPDPEYIGPSTTATTEAADPGDICLVVATNAGMQTGDRISVVMRNDDVFCTTILTTYKIGYLLQDNGDRILLEDGSGYLIYEDTEANTTYIGLAVPLPYGVASGAVVVNNTRMTAATLR